MKNFNLDPIVQYITKNDMWDISRAGDADYLYFYLHGSEDLTKAEMLELIKSPAFIKVSTTTDGDLRICLKKADLLQR
jgi:hypothetical protein